MSVKENISRLMTPRGRHLSKWLIKPAYRRQHRELSRLRALPRFQAAETALLGRNLELVDAASFVFMFGEIFDQQIYRFKAKSETPYIIDGGANIGLSALYFKRLYPQSRIVAFEPDEVIFPVLERNLQTFGHTDVRLLRRALWSKETELNFMSEGADGGRVAQANDRENQTVQAVRLRDYLDEPVDFLKLDIEGAETEVLEDCAECLRNVEHLFVEYHSFARQPQTLHRVTGILAAAGFRLHIQIATSSPQPFISREVYHGMDMQLNIFAFRT
jgi:FkbM family methyltransferase